MRHLTGVFSELGTRVFVNAAPLHSILSLSKWYATWCPRLKVSNSLAGISDRIP
jgi:hypothetical protein